MAYAAPEVIFDYKKSVASDIWALGCVLFEIVAGEQLFDDQFGIDDDLIKQLVQVLGKLPEKYWKAWGGRGEYFEENGESKIDEDGELLAVKLPLKELVGDIGRLEGVDYGDEDDEEVMREKVSQYFEQLRLRDKDEASEDDTEENDIDDEQSVENVVLLAEDSARPSAAVQQDPMLAPRGHLLKASYKEKLTDLLAALLKYVHEERIPLKELLRSPWFDDPSESAIEREERLEDVGAIVDVEKHAEQEAEMMESVEETA